MPGQTDGENRVPYSELRRDRSVPQGFRSIIPILAIVIVGLLVHGIQTRELGLYWDDGEQFMQGMQAADGDIMRFVLSDTSGYLRTERPLGYFAFLFARLGYAISLPALHWTLVGLFILNAVVLANITRRIVDVNWFVFAVGITFLLYPLSPLQAIWPATIHYLVASLLTLLTVLFALYGLRPTERYWLRWFTLAALTYLASMLMNEEFALMPLAFVSLYLVSRNGERTAEMPRRVPLHLHRPAIWGLTFFLGTALLYGLWREKLLPIYGTYLYPSSKMVLAPRVLTEKLLIGLSRTFIPWNDALKQILAYPPALGYLLLSMVPSVAVWRETFRFLRDAPSRNYSTPESELRISGDGRWLRAAITGIAFVIAAVLIIAVSSVRMGRINLLSVESRVNFATTIGVAVLLPALLALLVRLPALLVWLVTSYNRAAFISSALALSFLMFTGFVRFPFGGNILSHQSRVAEVFGRYSVAYVAALIAYAVAVILAILVVILASATWARKIEWSRRRDPKQSPLSLILAHLLSAAVACLVLVASLFHFGVKEQFIAEWSQHRVMLEKLRGIAPALKDNSFVVIVDARPDRPLSAPYSTHWELSSYMLALYDNWTIMGNTNRQLRFHLDGVESTYYGQIGTWFPPGVKGPVLTHATLPTRRIAYDRLLLIEYNGNTLRMLPKLEVRTEEGEHLVVHNNPARILIQAPVSTLIWQRLINGKY